tara:strand:+ start:112 stop:609 length:498 start_codon:yes stop_codon:yes gene_type:complete
MIRIALLWAFSTAAFASPASLIDVAAAPDLRQLSEQSDRVVRGAVLATRTEREQDNAYTIATVRVLETLRGDVQPVIDVRLPGASLAHHELMVHGGARLITGHEVLLFLSGDRIVNRSEGVFVVKHGSAWRGSASWTWSDPETLGEHRDDHYVNLEIDAIKSFLR